MRNGYDCWLFLIAIYIIGEKRPHVTELHFVPVLHWVAEPYQEKSSIRGPFSGFKRKHQLQNESDIRKHW